MVPASTSRVRVSPVDGPHPKRMKLVIKKIDKPILLVVGEDVPLNDIVLTNELTLVGQFSGNKTNVVGVNLWERNSWVESVLTVPEVFVLPHGWLAFKFHSPLDVFSVLAGS